MTVESVTFISDFNTANPSAGDLKSEGDDHIRNIKIGVKGSFPNLVGAASPGSMGTSLGLVGTPAYSFAGDADTGMWSPAANTLAWSVAGAEIGRMTVTGLTVTLANTSTALTALSGAANKYAGVSVGRVAAEASFGIVGTANDFLTGTVAGDVVLQGSTGVIYIGNTGAAGVAFVTNNLTRGAFDGVGRFYGTALHNNASAVTGTTNQYVASGTYTPTLTNTTNITASTAYVSQWIRVGNVVTVSGKFDQTPTAASGTIMGLSLPIASNLTATEQCAGTGMRDLSSGGSSPFISIKGDAANDRATVNFNADGLTSMTFYFQFTYVVL